MSHTIPQDTLVVSLVIDVHEERNKVIYDIPGSYLHSNMPTSET